MTTTTESAAPAPTSRAAAPGANAPAVKAHATGVESGADRYDELLVTLSQ